jgi:hypothetical protein
MIVLIENFLMVLLILLFATGHQVHNYVLNRCKTTSAFFWKPVSRKCTLDIQLKNAKILQKIAAEISSKASG